MSFPANLAKVYEINYIFWFSLKIVFFQCGKRIRFGKVAMKCKDCRATAHPDCKDQVPLPCVPSQQTPATGKLSGVCRHAL